MRKLLLLMLAFLPLALAVACGSDDNKSSSSSGSASSGTTSPGDALSSAVAGAATSVSTRVAGAGTVISQGAGTVQAGAATVVTGASTQVAAGAGTVQAGAGTQVAGAATQVTGAATARAGNPNAIALPITDADAARDALLNAAKTGDWSKTGSATDLSQYPAWQNIANAVKLAGAAVAADPNTVSVYRDTLNSGQPASASNPKVIAFTVDDQNGKCSAGAIKGYPDYSTYQSVQLQGKPCTAQSVVDQLKSSS